MRMILVVDDNQFNRSVLVRVLAGEYRVMEASDGREAVAILNEHGSQISAVLLDLMMPEMDGYEVLAYMRQTPALSKIPVIVTTARTDAQSEERALELGANDFVTKPYSPEVIRHRLHITLNLQDVAPQGEEPLREALPYIMDAIMESSTDLYFAKDKTFRYILCSRSFARVLCAKDENDIIGKTDYELFDASVADQLRMEDSRLISEGKTLENCTLKLPGDNGSMRYYSTSKYVLRDERGLVIGLYGVGRDITEYRATYEQLRLLTDSIPGGLGIFEVSPRGARSVYLSDGVYKLMGYTRNGSNSMPLGDALRFTFKEDMQIIERQIDALMRFGTPVDCVYRVHTGDGGYKWLSLKGTVSERHGDTVIANAVFLDVTDKQQTEENLRMSADMFRIAAALGDRKVARYDIKTRTLYHDSDILDSQGFSGAITNVPEVFVEANLVSEESRDDLFALYDKIYAGEQNASANVALIDDTGAYRWYRMDATTVFDSEGAPSSAIIVLYDITEQREQEAVYKKWQQSLNDKPPGSYSLFRYNLNKHTLLDSVEGSLLSIEFKPGTVLFNERTEEYAGQYVHADDYDMFTAFLDSEALLTKYYTGSRADTLEYREHTQDGGFRWLRLSVELVEYPNSKDIEAYLMFEDIDEIKRAEIAARELAENDALTGVLNRKAFVAKMNELLTTSPPGAQHALFMLDIDGFKMLNDGFGHAAGDQALIDIACALRSILRRGDLVGRLGGDEFIMCLKDISSDIAIENKARQICALARRAYSLEVQISVSIGIAVSPRDGHNFEALYHKVDAALYHVKNTGKDNFAFYAEEMSDESPNPDGLTGQACLKSLDKREVKRRMLIVDDNRMNRELLVSLFKDEFIIDTASDGNAALIRLRRYGAGISVVLLDLVMPGMDGFAVLDKMRNSMEMQSIPVIVVSGANERETSLKTIKSGASDFVTKPVDPDLIRLRVHSAISKSENERARAHNSYLMLQNHEVSRYRAVLDRLSTVVVELDWNSCVFTYDSLISHYIAGSFDQRGMWRVLMSDMVADVMDVKRMQKLVHDIAEDKSRSEGGMEVYLKTPSGQKHVFEMNAYKLADEFSLPDKIIITFKDTRVQVV